MRHLALISLVLLIAGGLPAWAEDDPAPPVLETPVDPLPDPIPATPVDPMPDPIPATPVDPMPDPFPATPIDPLSDVVVEEPPVVPLPSTPVPPVPATLPVVPPPTTQPARKVLRTEILDIRKTHNLPWRCYCSAIRLDVDFMVVGQKERFVGARVDFYSENGQPIKSVLYPFANERGQVSAWTHLIQMTQGAARMHTALMIPYKAFPCACEGDSYLVTARVILLRREGRAQSSEIARGETTFTVWSSGEDSVDDIPLDADDAGTGGESTPEGEYRPQVPYGDWPDHTEMEADLDRRTKELGRRADAELGTGTRGPGPGPSPAPTR